MKVYVAADHAGFALKEAIVPFLRDELGNEVDDCGAVEFDSGDDYPAIIACAAQAVSLAADKGEDVRAIVFGKSGQGEAMVANRFHGVRAAVYYGSVPALGAGDAESIIRLSREHNDANVLSIGAGFVDESDAKDAIKEWLSTSFSGEDRHQYRIKAIDSVLGDAKN